MRIRNTIIGGVLAAAVAAAGVYVTIPAEASIPPEVAGNITILARAPRVVSSPGTAFAANEEKSFQIAGRTFGGYAIPANATGVTLAASVTGPAAAGKLTVWTAEAGRPGTPSVTYAAGQSATSLVFVGLNSEGRINVHSTAAANVLLAIEGYVTPVVPPTIPDSSPEVKTIAAKAPTALTGVGGSIRTKSTTFGSVELSAGTWDAHVMGGWTGLNNGDKACTPDGTFLTGSMVLVRGDAASFEFADVVATAGGVLIPESNSASLTQDPTATISSVFTLAEATKVTVRLFGYASDSSTACEGVLKGNLQGAQFVKLS